MIIQLYYHFACTIASKINVTPKGVYLPISKLHSILAVANLLAHNNKSQICYCGQNSLQSAAVNCSLSDTFGGTNYFAVKGSYISIVYCEFNTEYSFMYIIISRCTVTSKINGTPKVFTAHFETTLDLSHSEFTCP